MWRLAFIVALLAGAAGWPDAKAAAPSTFKSAEECANCHRDIHKHWKSSMHAQSADNWRFQDALLQVRRENDPDGVATCVRCHAPLAAYGSDPGWSAKATWEGVTCDFCHSVTSIGLNPARPFVVNPGSVKTGPLRDAAAVGHETRYSDVHTSSTLCQPCHQFVNRQKLAVLSTYSEWQASGYAAKNVTCQSCHMRATSGKIVDPKVRRVPGQTVNLHEMPGGHSVTELNRALLAAVTATRNGGALEVAVQLTNRGAGHMIPTGSPLRTIEMVVEVDSGVGARQRMSKTYGRTVLDVDGNELKDEPGVWLRGARFVRDDRLAPNERRTEKFTFNASPRHAVRTVAKFYYRYGAATVAEVPFLAVSAWTPAVGTE